MKKQLVDIGFLLALALALWVLVDLWNFLLIRNVYNSDWLQSIAGNQPNPHKLLALHTVPVMLLAALPVVFVLRERFSSHVYLLALVIALPLAASFAYEYAPYYNVSSTTDQRLILMHLALRLTAASVVAALVFRLLPTIDTRESLGRSYAYALFFAPILVASIGYLLDFEAASDWIFWVGVCGAGIGLISMSHYTRGKSNGRELPYLLIAIFWGGVGSSLSWTVFS